ncbi:MAG: hypothetical protein H6683_00620 [Deltaproteobacteria bacterium]|nr:hypothetical protein [Deltaproteobacteria bacterium]
MKQLTVFLTAFSLFIALSGCAGGGDDDDEESHLADTDDDVDDDDDSAAPEDDLDDDSADDDVEPEGPCGSTAVYASDGECVYRLRAWETGKYGASIGYRAMDRTLLIASTVGRDLTLFSRPLDEPSAAWDVETVASFAITPSMAVDGAGYVHLAFQDLRTDSLAYVTNASGAWVFETVDAIGWDWKINPKSHPWLRTKIAVANDGGVHVAYVRPADQEVLYAVRKDGVWTTQVLETGETRWDGSEPVWEYPGKWLELAVDSAGAAHVIYKTHFGRSFSGEGRETTYAANVPGNWELQRLPTVFDDKSSDASITDVNFPHLAIDGTGRPAVTFTTDDDLMYFAVYDGKTWALQMVSEKKISDTYDLIFDAGNRALVFPRACPGSAVSCYFEQDGENWMRREMDFGDVHVKSADAFEFIEAESGNLQAVATIADSAQDVHLTHLASGSTWTAEDLPRPTEEFGSDLRSMDGEGHAHFMHWKDGAWRHVEFDGREFTHQTVSLDTPPGNGARDFIVTPSGDLHLVYKPDHDADETYHLRRVNGEWAFDEMSTGEHSLYSVALGVMPDERIAFLADVWKSEYSNIQFFTPDGGDGWSGESSNLPGASWPVRRLPFDQDGFAHLLYFAGGLKYATNTTGEWTTQLIPSTKTDDVTLDDYVVSADGAIHGVTEDRESGRLVYATNASGDWVVEWASSKFVEAHSARIAMQDDEVHVVYGVESVLEPRKGVVLSSRIDGEWQDRILEVADGQVQEFWITPDGRMHTITSSFGGTYYSVYE